jgi:hypothetical protein
MKKISTFILATVMVMTLSQCKKNEQNTTADKGVAITLNVIDDDNSNSRVEVNTTTGTVDFENNDQILVASGGKYVGTLTYNGELFTGSVYDAVAGYPLSFYFLGNITPAETLTYGETQSCSVVITDQTQHLPVVSYAPSNENYGTTTDFTSHLLNKCALVKFNVTSASEAATCITGFNNKVTVSFAESTLTPSQEGNGVITLPAGTGERWAILLPQAALAAGGAGTAYSADNAYTGTRGAVPAIGYNAFLTAGIPVTLEAGGSGGGGGGGTHEYVDLGLPSGLLWATCNVGADTPEGYGDYFAWGETTTKDTYNWSTYQYCMGSYNTMTKYCNNSSYGYNGFTDNLTVLLPEDDAATANWGSSWRMPTKEECQELYNSTTHSWTTQNGVYGRRFTASNGNSIFFPAAGLRVGSNLNAAGTSGYYYSSSLYTGRSDLAWWFYFNSEDNYGMGNLNGRRDGYSVRPVYSGQPSITTYTITVSANPAEGGNAIVIGGNTFQSGETCTVTATANSGYTFTNWTENGSVVTTDVDYSFNVNANRTLVANFTYNGGGGGNIPTGAINGLFSVSATQQVYFSQGNLQYQASTNTWRFAENQWDHVGGTNYFGTYGNVYVNGVKCDNSLMSSSYSGWIDLFGWGTSGYNHGAICYQPWSTSTTASDYYVYGENTYNLYDQTGQADWGYNIIINGGYMENYNWRTLTQSEWDYVFNTRTTVSGIRFVIGKVNNVKGVVLLPDNWSESNYTFNKINGGTFSSNDISLTDWENTFEVNGAVFLPTGGRRNGTTVDGQGNASCCYYWSSSRYNNNVAYHIYVTNGYFNVHNAQLSRYYGHSVRLVRNAQ